MPRIYKSFDHEDYTRHGNGDYRSGEPGLDAQHWQAYGVRSNEMTQKLLGSFPENLRKAPAFKVAAKTLAEGAIADDARAEATYFMMKMIGKQLTAMQKQFSAAAKPKKAVARMTTSKKQKLSR